MWSFCKSWFLFLARQKFVFIFSSHTWITKGCVLANIVVKPIIFGTPLSPKCPLLTLAPNLRLKNLKDFDGWNCIMTKLFLIVGFGFIKILILNFSSSCQVCRTYFAGPGDGRYTCIATYVVTLFLYTQNINIIAL